MKFKGPAIILAFIFALGFIAHDASAKGREPASCILFPYYDTLGSSLAIISITNTSGVDDVHVRIVFLSPENGCVPKDYWRTLTQYDTFTFVDHALNTQQGTGFLYVYVVESFGSKIEKKNDCLVGQEYIFSVWRPGGGLVNYGVNAASFAVGTNNITADGKLKLNGNEFDEAPTSIIFPRFFGQEAGFQSKLILISLTGGQFFSTNYSARIFDDSEHEFSDGVSEAPCFWYGDLSSQAAFPDTTELALDGTSTDLDELFDGLPTMGAASKQTGWIEITGVNSHFFTNDFRNPGIYGLLIEQVGAGYAADLPWEVFGGASNAMLWSVSVNGD
jgi:hypothetical protein